MSSITRSRMPRGVAWRSPHEAGAPGPAAPSAAPVALRGERVEAAGPPLCTQPLRRGRARAAAPARTPRRAWHLVAGRRSTAGRLAPRRAPQFSRALSTAPAVPTGRIRTHATATAWPWRRATTQSTNAASRSTAARRLSMPAASKPSASSSARAVADDLVEDMPWVGLSGYVFTRDAGTLVLRARSHSPSAFACASRRSVEVAPVPSSPRMRKLTAPRLGNS
jgi:hypothetical protein